MQSTEKFHFDWTEIHRRHLQKKKTDLKEDGNTEYEREVKSSKIKQKIPQNENWQ